MRRAASRRSATVSSLELRWSRSIRRRLLVARNVEGVPTSLQDSPTEFAAAKSAQMHAELEFGAHARRFSSPDIHKRSRRFSELRVYLRGFLAAEEYLLG